MTCNELNIHPRDSRLTFDAESHTYYCDGTECISVTTLVEECFPRFDSEYWAAKIGLRDGVDPDIVIDRWAREAERARALGTTMHAKIERYYLGDDDGDDTDALRLFRMFAAHNTLYPYRTEWRVFDEDFSIAGTIDFLERTPSGTYNIYDWKRSKKLVEADGRIIMQSPFNKRAHYPLNHLHDTSYWHYALQLSIYRHILERKYGIRVSALKLGVFHPSCSTPWIITVPYLAREVETLMSQRVSAGVKCC